MRATTTWPPKALVSNAHCPTQPGHGRRPLADNSRDASDLSPKLYIIIHASPCLALPPAMSLIPVDLLISQSIQRHDPITETNGATRPNLGGVGCHPATMMMPRHPGCDAGLGSAPDLGI